MESYRIARAGGWAALAAGIFGTVGAVVLIFIPPAVSENVFSYPLTAEGHLTAQIIFGVHHFVAAFALWGVLAGRTRRPEPVRRGLRNSICGDLRTVRRLGGGSRRVWK